MLAVHFDITSVSRLTEQENEAEARKSLRPGQNISKATKGGNCPPVDRDLFLHQPIGKIRRLFVSKIDRIERAAIKKYQEICPETRSNHDEPVMDAYMGGVGMTRDDVKYSAMVPNNALRPP